MMFMLLAFSTGYTAANWDQPVQTGLRYCRSLIHKLAKPVLPIIYDYPSLIKHNRLTNASIKQNALCSGIFIRKDQLQRIDSHTFGLKTYPLGKDKNLFSTDLLYHERYVRKAAGSCFIKDEHTVSTAYHIEDTTGLSKKMFIENYYAVFGFTNTTDETVLISRENIIELEDVADAEAREDRDFIDFRIKGKVPSFIKIPKQYSSDLKKGMEIYVAGYPLRSSLTISANASISEVYYHYFTAHVDVFEFSNGSPVFLAHNNELIGFVKGSSETDFAPSRLQNYMQTNIIQSSQSNGKKIILINKKHENSNH